MNALDKFIAWVSPKSGLSRARARLALTQTRRYEAAASGRRTDSWLAQGLSANSEIAVSLHTLRDRHRDLVKNNPWAARAVQAIVSNMIGYGITAKIKGTKKAQLLWKSWAESTECDADGRHDIYGLQALVQRTVVESGECFIRRRWRRVEDGLSVPMQLQVLEPDYLDISRTEYLNGGGRIIQGVEFNAFGKRVAYWMYQDHPGDQITKTFESVRVPASEVAHIMRTDRPGQVRGVPWGSAVMLTMRDLDDYEDAYLFRQKLANCTVGLIYDADPLQPGANSNQPIAESFEPGRYEFLPPGKDIKFNTPPNAGDYGPYTKDVLLRVAAAYGITFQALTGDLSSVNFSSGRMGWLEMQRNIESWRWHYFIPQFCETIAGWWEEAVELSYGIKTQSIAFQWMPPRREMIDPAKEIPPLIEAMRGGITSLPRVHGEMGEDSEEILNEIAETNVLLDKLGLKLDSDPRQTTKPNTQSTQDNQLSQ